MQSKESEQAMSSSDTPAEKTPVAEIVPVFDAGVALRPVMNVAAAMQQLAEFQDFVKQYLVAGEDYGTIPGTPKPTLYKSGAEKLCDIYGMADDYLKVKETEDWEKLPPLFDYEFKCILTSRRDQRFLGSGFGSCNSHESKYKWRETKRKCPLCGKEAIIKGQEQYGGGWICWKKRDGCGAKFLDTDKAIVDQKAGREANEDIADIKNTILKMAKKRAKIDAVIAVTRSSGIFTQDMEEHVEQAEAGKDEGTRTAAQRVAEAKIAKGKEKVREIASKTQAEPSQLCVYPHGDGFEVTGEPETMNLYKDVLLANGKKSGVVTVFMTAEQLDTFKFEFCEKRGGILTSLKAAKA